MKAAWLLGGVSAVVLGACGGYSVPYEGAQGLSKKAGEVPVYDINCKDPAMGVADCTYNGGPMMFKPLGIFRVPGKALKDWQGYRKKVQEQAARYGCPAVALRRMGPVAADAQTVGGFCIDPAAAPSTAGGTAPDGPGVGVSVSATATVGACQQAADCPTGTVCNRGVCGPAK